MPQQKTLDSLWGKSSTTNNPNPDPAVPGNNAPAAAAHHDSFDVETKNKIRKLVKKKLRPRTQELKFDITDEWVYYHKEDPEVSTHHHTY